MGDLQLPKLGKYKAPVDEKTIGTNLKAARTRRGLTQVQIAKKLGIDQALVSGYERGTIRIHGAILAAFAKTYDTSADQILGLKPSKVNSVHKERRFFRRLQEIEKLPRRRKDTLLTVLDTFLDGRP